MFILKSISNYIFLFFLFCPAIYSKHYQKESVSHGATTIEKLRGYGRIIDGSPAVNGQFPHHALIITMSSGGSRSACGGSLINSKWVLTAAHCTTGVSAEIFLGDVNRTASPVMIRSKRMIPHPNYNSVNYNNDIALIELERPVTYTSNIQPISLAKDPKETFANMDAIVSGFGTTESLDSLNPTLKFAVVRVISNAVCARSFPENYISSSTLCIVGKDNAAQGACHGDSGGPLILKIKGVMTQIGAVSFASADGCKSATPNGFSRVSSFATWIKSHTKL